MKDKKAKKILEDVKITYNSIAGDFSNTRNRIGEEFKIYEKYILPGSKILDLGCGNGRLLIFLKGLIGEQKLSTNYTGVDNSKQLLEIAKQKHPGFHFEQGDQLQIPLKDDSCDIVFNVRAFHHIPSKKLRKEAILEMKRLLKKDGVLIISVWNLWQFKYAKELATAFARSVLTVGGYDYNDTLIKWGKQRKRYYHAFTRGEFKRTIKAEGLEIIDFKDINHDFVIIARK